jgi:hypothetical protein
VRTAEIDYPLDKLTAIPVETGVFAPFFRAKLRPENDLQQIAIGLAICGKLSY